MAGFYKEVTGITDPPATFYMACGFHRGHFMGIENGCFFLSHGGFIERFTESGTKFDRPADGMAPADLNLPPLPEQVRASPARA
jgi:hypothetical protein